MNNISDFLARAASIKQSIVDIYAQKLDASRVIAQINENEENLRYLLTAFATVVYTYDSNHPLNAVLRDFAPLRWRCDEVFGEKAGSTAARECERICKYIDLFTSYLQGKL